MSTRQQQQEISVIPFAQLSFSGGINTASPYDRLADNEAIDILNFRFGEDDSLLPRRGTYTTIEQISAADITNRITSVYQALYQDGTGRMLFTSSNQLYEDVAGVATNRTGALSLATDTFYQWKMFGNLAIGVNRDTVGDNPIKVATGAGNGAALTGSPPKAKYIEIWANRVWLTGATNSTRNRLFGSALGNAEDWTTTGTAGRVIIDIEPDDGDMITGLVAFRERLFVFKRNRIYTIQALGGAYAEDASALTRELYSSSIGCASAYSIQPVLDDVLFLTDGGIASLVSSERVGDFSSALLSRKIKELRDLVLQRQTDLEIAAFVVPEHNQYWLLARNTQAAFTYILDYRRIQEGLVRWSRFNGALLGDVMCRETVLSGTVRTRYRIGGPRFGQSGKFAIYGYEMVKESFVSQASYNDNTGSASGQSAVQKFLRTRLIDCGLPFIRKHFHRLFVDLIAILVDDVGATTVSITYMLDNNFSKTGTWTVTIPDNTSTSLGYQSLSQLKVNRKFKYNTFGSKAVNMHLDLTCTGSTQAFGVKGITLFYTPLTEKRANSLTS